VLLPEDRRQNDLPYKFYGISGSGRQFLEEHKLYRAQDTLREIYDRVEDRRHQTIRDCSATRALTVLLSLRRRGVTLNN